MTAYRRRAARSAYHARVGASGDVLRFVGPMAVGFIIVAAVRIGRKVVKDVPTALLMPASGFSVANMIVTVLDAVL